jgi:hypothetical protein
VMRGDISHDAQDRMQKHAMAHSRHAIAVKWEQMICGVIDARRGGSAYQDSSRPDVQVRPG